MEKLDRSDLNFFLGFLSLLVAVLTLVLQVVPKEQRLAAIVVLIVISVVFVPMNLSLNFTFAPTDDGASKEKQGQIIGGLLFPTDQQAAKAIDP